MAFLDKNENVIQIKLTQFGKTLLSQGAWKPEYYRFFDDNVIYDVAHAGDTEDQNKAQERIKSGLATETRYINHSLQNRYEVETRLIENESQTLFNPLVKNQKIQEKEGLLRNPIGRCDLGSEQSPLFSLTATDAEINTTVGLQYVTNSNSSQQIPEVKFEANYRLVQDLREQRSTPSDDLYDSETYISLASERVTFMDNTTLTIEPEELAFILRELNTPEIENSFMVEFFEEIQTQDGQPDQLRPLMTQQEVEELFYIKKDDEADKAKDDKIQTKNFFMNN